MAAANVKERQAGAARRTVAVVGAGIVGVATAIWLQRDGHDVVLVDREGPAAGASFGNGGVLASCSIVPVTEPGIIAKAPMMLLDPRQPLFMKWSYLPRLAPWLMRYLRHAGAAEASRIATALFPVIGDSLADHQALAHGTGAEKWIVPSDFVFVYDNRAKYEKDGFAWSLRRAHGFDWQELEGAAFRDYDPAFAAELGFAARVGGHGHVTDPARYIESLAAHFVAQGGRLVLAEVTDIVRDNGQVTGVRISGRGGAQETLVCDAAVVTAGAWSGGLTRRLGLSIPLESERGYHLELWQPTIMPRSPVMISSGKFVATPMDGRLRLAGIVEFGGLEATPSKAPFRLLEDNIRRAIPGLAWKETSQWMGHRPTLSDSIPVIGEVPGITGAFVGFGHHHVGLTGGPKTGRLIAQLVSGHRPNTDMTPYSPARFG